VPSNFELEAYRHCIQTGLRILGVDNLFLQIHDASFPSFEDEETGRGSPCSRGGARFIERVRNVGFNGLQLGPQGATAYDNPSPYDATLFSRNPLSVDLRDLVEAGWLEAGQLDEWLNARPAGRERVHYRFAFATMETALTAAYEHYRQRRAQGDTDALAMARRIGAFSAANRTWLEPDALYTVLQRLYAGQGWEAWTEAAGQPQLDQRLWYPLPGEESAVQARRAALVDRYAAVFEYYAFVQLHAHAQHDRLRKQCRELGLKLYADLQIGLSDRDAWSRQALFLRDYRLGAPPSRTNPEGQPWGFRVLDPRQYIDSDGNPGPALRFVAERLRKVRAEYDGIRVDHPQGWVSPWVYRTDIANPFHAVQNGGRLFASPDLPDHPALRAFALVRPEQLNHDLPRHADHWVRELDEAQVTRYATLFRHLAAAGSDGEREVMCEVLSTMPYPLQRVMRRYGLGRFRVLQNANPHDPYDVYRSDNAQPSDWIMLGNHDTRPIWQLAPHWRRTGEARERAADLSQRLAPSDAQRSAWAERVAAEPGELVHALFADMLHSKARNIMVFVSDMLGVQERYNTPGTVSDDNWSLRVPPNFEQRYLSRVADNQALSLPYALLLALKARSDEVSADLIRLMETEVERLRAAGRAFTETAAN